MKKKLPKIFFTKFCLISNIFTKYFLIKIFLEKYTVLYQQFDKITFFLSAGIHGTCHFFSSQHKPNISPTFISLFLLFSNCRASFARQNFAIPNSFLSSSYFLYLGVTQSIFSQSNQQLMTTLQQHSHLPQYFSMLGILSSPLAIIGSNNGQYREYFNKKVTTIRLCFEKISVILSQLPLNNLI